MFKIFVILKPLETEMVTIAVTSPIWFSIGLAVLLLGAPFVGIMVVKDKVQDTMKLKKYKEDKCAFMAKKSANYLDVVKTGLTLKTFVKDQMKKANLCLKQIEARIPELIQADKKLYYSTAFSGVQITPKTSTNIPRY